MNVTRNDVLWLKNINYTTFLDTAYSTTRTYNISGFQDLTYDLAYTPCDPVTVTWKGAYVGGPKGYVWNPYQSLTTYLKNGDLIGFIVSPYTNLMGDMFWALIVLIISFPIYMKTGSLSYVAVMWLLLGSALGSLIPASANRIAWILIGLGVSIIFYKMIEKARK